MLRKLIDHSPDLNRLKHEGYEIVVRNNYLMINNVPYLDSKKEIQYGTFVTEITISGDKLDRPNSHVIHFIGEHPCALDGNPINQIKHASQNRRIAEDIIVNHSFSNKPKDGYANYYEKMTTYINIVSAPARFINEAVTAKTFKSVEIEEEESVFKYSDTNSSRAEINHITDKLKSQKIGIIGLGGTGSYILDLIAKTPVAEIHLFDRDKFIQHNAFRTPGAPTLEKLQTVPKKVDYLFDVYSNMHKNIFPHTINIDYTNAEQLREFDFVFVCIDKSNVKQEIIEKLEEFGISFIDVGMGVEVVNESLIGILRTTTSTNTKRDHVRSSKRISFSDGDGKDDYSQNIQIAELNSLNAAMAVIKWKKLCGFYNDLEKEHHSTYSINVNQLLSEDSEL